MAAEPEETHESASQPPPEPQEAPEDPKQGSYETPVPERPEPEEAPEGAEKDPQQGSHETPVPERPEPEETPPEPLPEAEPGVYRCVEDVPGEHAVLGVLTQGEAYDYTHADAHTLQAVAAYVELGALEKVEGGESPESSSSTEETPADEPSDR